MTDQQRFAPVLDALAKVAAGAIEGANIFAAATTPAVTDTTPLVTPMADDFTQAGLPAVLVALGSWKAAGQPGNERLHITAMGSIWRPRFPLDVNHGALLEDLDAVLHAFEAHGRAYDVVPTISSVLVTGGPGIVARRLSPGEGPEEYLTAPWTAEVVCNRAVTYQPA